MLNCEEKQRERYGIEECLEDQAADFKQPGRHQRDYRDESGNGSSARDLFCQETQEQTREKYPEGAIDSRQMNTGPEKPEWNRQQINLRGVGPLSPAICIELKEKRKALTEFTLARVRNQESVVGDA